jgi:hypothetical protein
LKPPVGSIESLDDAALRGDARTGEASGDSMEPGGARDSSAGDAADDNEVQVP